MTTRAGFRGAFFALNGRLPTEQEIFDEGIREGMRRAALAGSANKVDAMLVKHVADLEAALQKAKEAGFTDSDLIEHPEVERSPIPSLDDWDGKFTQGIPQKKLYQLWVEAHRESGKLVPVFKAAEYEGFDFDDAIKRYLRTVDIIERRLWMFDDERGRWIRKFSRVYETEEEARQAR